MGKSPVTRGFHTKITLNNGGFRGKITQDWRNHLQLELGTCIEDFPVPRLISRGFVSLFFSDVCMYDEPEILKDTTLQINCFFFFFDESFQRWLSAGCPTECYQQDFTGKYHCDVTDAKSSAKTVSGFKQMIVEVSDHWVQQYRIISQWGL